MKSKLTAKVIKSTLVNLSQGIISRIILYMAGNKSLLMIMAVKSKCW
jgi:hypothetical protein